MVSSIYDIQAQKHIGENSTIGWYILLSFLKCIFQFIIVFLFRQLFLITFSIAIFIVIQYFTRFLAGFSLGVMMCYIIFQIYLKVHPSTVMNCKTPNTTMLPSFPSKILEIQAVKEYQPLQKFEVSAFCLFIH